MPALRGIAPTSRATSASPNATLASSVHTTPASSGKAQSSSSIFTPFERAERRRDLEQLEDDGGVGAEHGTRGDAEQEAVADLAGSTGDGDTNRSGHAPRAYARRRPSESARRVYGDRSAAARARAEDEVGVEVQRLGAAGDVDAVGAEFDRLRFRGPVEDPHVGVAVGSALIRSLLPGTHSTSAAHGHEHDPRRIGRHLGHDGVELARR